MHVLEHTKIDALMQTHLDSCIQPVISHHHNQMMTTSCLPSARCLGAGHLEIVIDNAHILFLAKARPSAYFSSEFF
jgi:hypothetical protein